MWIMTSEHKNYHSITLLQAPYSKQCFWEILLRLNYKQNAFILNHWHFWNSKKINKTYLIICIMIMFPQQHYFYYYIYRWTDSQIILVLQKSSSDTLQNQLPCPWLSMKNCNKQVPRGILVPQLYCFACRNQ